MRKNIRKNTLKKVTIKGMLPASIHCSTIDLFQETELKQFQSLLVNFRFILKNHLEIRAIRTAILGFKGETDFKRGMAELRELMNDLFLLEERLIEQLSTSDIKLEATPKSAYCLSSTRDRFFNHLSTFIGTIGLESSLSFSQQVQQALQRLSFCRVIAGDLQCILQAIVRFSIQQKQQVLNLINSQATVLNLSMVFCDQIAEVQAQLQKSQILSIIRKLGKQVIDNDLQEFDCLLNNKIIQKIYLREQLQRNLPAEACRLQYYQRFYNNSEELDQCRFKSRLKEEMSRISISSKKGFKVEQKLSTRKQLDKRRSMISLMRSQKNVTFSEEEINIVPNLLSKISFKLQTLSNIQSRIQLSQQPLNHWEVVEENQNKTFSKKCKHPNNQISPKQIIGKKSAITLLWNKRRKFIMPSAKAPAQRQLASKNIKSEGNQEGWSLIDWRLGRYLHYHRQKHFELQERGRMSYYS